METKRLLCSLGALLSGLFLSAQVYTDADTLPLYGKAREQFFRIVRDAHPDVPVLFLEDPHFAHYEWDSKIKEEVDKKNAAQRELFEKLKKQGEKKIYYLKSDGMVGEDAEGFVENIHFTDLGMMRYADWISPYLRKYLKK